MVGANDLARLLPRSVPQPRVVDGASAERFAQSSTIGPAWYVLNVGSEVDITLIQETLALTPQQRIQQNDRVLRTIEELRDGLAKSGKSPRDPGSERR